MSSRETAIYIITERDCDSPFDSDGPILFEQYVNRRNDDEAMMERAQSFADVGRYGRVWVGRIVFADLIEVEAAKPATILPREIDAVAQELKRLRDVCYLLGDYAGKGQRVRGWYKSRRWQRRRAGQLRRKRWCQCPYHKGRHERDGGERATIADHVTPHRGDERRFWYGPLQSLAKHCHDTKDDVNRMLNEPPAGDAV